MKIVHLILISLLALTLANCQTSNNTNESAAVSQADLMTADPVEVPPTSEGLKKAYFASGCFWCVEAIYESVKGVKESISGYAGGHTENPTYEASNTGKTGHAEAVEIIYDPEVIDFATLVDVYFGSQNVTQVNGQGPDRGFQIMVRNIDRLFFIRMMLRKKSSQRKLMHLTLKLPRRKSRLK